MVWPIQLLTLHSPINLPCLLIGIYFSVFSRTIRYASSFKMVYSSPKLKKLGRKAQSWIRQFQVCTLKLLYTRCQRWAKALNSTEQRPVCIKLIRSGKARKVATATTVTATQLNRVWNIIYSEVFWLAAACTSTKRIKYRRFGFVGPWVAALFVEFVDEGNRG